MLHEIEMNIQIKKVIGTFWGLVFTDEICNANRSKDNDEMQNKLLKVEFTSRMQFTVVTNNQDAYIINTGQYFNNR